MGLTFKFFCLSCPCSFPHGFIVNSVSSPIPVSLERFSLSLLFTLGSFQIEAFLLFIYLFSDSHFSSLFPLSFWLLCCQIFPFFFSLGHLYNTLKWILYIILTIFKSPFLWGELRIWTMLLLEMFLSPYLKGNTATVIILNGTTMALQSLNKGVVLSVEQALCQSMLKRHSACPQNLWGSGYTKITKQNDHCYNVQCSEKT